MESCRGCRYLHDPFCSAQDGPWERKWNPYLARYEWIALIPHGRFRPFVDTMRAPEGDCGPMRLLYAPVWWRRALAWMMRSAVVSSEARRP